jgi:hypothetical protein
LQQRACPPIFQAATGQRAEPQETAAAAVAAAMERLPSVPLQPKSNDPDWFPTQQLTRASSEGSEANQGRCKCGEFATHLVPRKTSIAPQPWPACLVQIS